MGGVAVERAFLNDFEDAVAIGLKAIEGKFIVGDPENDEGGADADGEAENVDDAEEPAAAESTGGVAEIGC